MSSPIKTVLLTGATGFLGSHLLEALLAERYDVVVAKRSNSRTDKTEGLLGRAKVYNIDKGGLESTFDENHIDAVLHVATLYARESTSLHDVVESNILFGTRLLDLCSSHEVKLFVNTDTFSNDGEVSQAYLCSYILSKKQFAEWLFLRQTRFKAINLKLQHMYGPRDDVSKFIPWVINQLAEGKPFLELTPGMQRRDFVYVSDVVAAYLKVLELHDSMPASHTYNVGTGVKTSLKDMLDELRIEVSRRQHVSTEFRFGALPYRDGEKLDVSTDISALRALGWKPSVDVSSGLCRTVDYYLHG